MAKQKVIAVARREERTSRKRTADDSPSSGIVALFDERWVAEAEKVTANADKVSKHEVDKDSAEQARPQRPAPRERDEP